MFVAEADYSTWRTSVRRTHVITRSAPVPGGYWVTTKAR